MDPNQNMANLEIEMLTDLYTRLFYNFRILCTATFTPVSHKVHVPCPLHSLIEVVFIVLVVLSMNNCIVHLFRIIILLKNILRMR